VVCTKNVDFLGDLSSSSSVAWLSEYGAEESLAISLAVQCNVSEMIVKKSPRDLRRPMIYRCRYEEAVQVVCQRQPEMVERPYVISMRGTYLNK
jgi:hypothetical protein